MILDVSFFFSFFGVGFFSCLWSTQKMKKAIDALFVRLFFVVCFHPKKNKNKNSQKESKEREIATHFDKERH